MCSVDGEISARNLRADREDGEGRGRLALVMGNGGRGGEGGESAEKAERG